METFEAFKSHRIMCPSQKLYILASVDFCLNSLNHKSASRSVCSWNCSKREKKNSLQVPAEAEHMDSVLSKSFSATCDRGRYGLYSKNNRC